MRRGSIERCTSIRRMHSTTHAATLLQDDHDGTTAAYAMYILKVNVAKAHLGGCSNVADLGGCSIKCSKQRFGGMFIL